MNELLQHHTCETCKHLDPLFSKGVTGERTQIEIHICSALDLYTLPQAYKIFAVKKDSNGYWRVMHGDCTVDSLVQNCPAWAEKGSA